MNRWQGPQRPKVGTDGPGPVSYELLKDDRTILGTRKRSTIVSLGTTSREQNKKLERFMDTHEKSKRWLPDPSKYFTEIDK